LLALDEWLSAYTYPHATEAMVAWLSSISWPGVAITSVQEQMDQVFRMEDTLIILTANNALLNRYLTRSVDVRLQWVTRLSRLPPWIQAHLKTVEGCALLALDQATLLQTDDERLQLTRVLPGGGLPGNAVLSRALPSLDRPHLQLDLVLWICYQRQTCLHTTLDWLVITQGDCSNWW